MLDTNMVAKQPRNIFILHPSDFLTDHEPHGDGLTAFGFIRELARRDYRLHVAARQCSLSSPLPSNVTLYQLPVRVRVPLLDRVEYMIRARRLFQRLQYAESIEIIHQMNPVFAGLSLAVTGTRVPIVLGTIVPCWPDDPDSLLSRHPLVGKLLLGIKRVIVGWQQKAAAILLLTSPAALNRVPYPEAIEHKVMFVPHGIDTEAFSPASPGECSQSAPTVLFLANLQRRKGIFVLLKAFERVAQAVPGCRLRIVGSGPESASVAEQVKRMPCGDQIELVPNVARDRVVTFLRECTVYCLPSLGEPYGASLVEAMCCGIPVVGTAAGGFPYLVPEGGGRLVPPRNPDALAMALIEVLTDEALQRSMGTVNRDHAVASLSWSRAVDRLEIAYRVAFSQHNVSNSIIHQAGMPNASAGDARQ